jgi:hypothetical protein
MGTKNDAAAKWLGCLLETSLHASNQIASEIPRSGSPSISRVELTAAAYRFSLRAWLISQILVRPPFERPDLAESIHAATAASLPILQARPGYWAETVTLLLVVEILYQALAGSLVLPELESLKEEKTIQRLIEKSHEFIQGAGDIYGDRFEIASNLEIALKYVKPLRLGALPVLYEKWSGILQDSWDQLLPLVDAAYRSGAVSLDGKAFQKRVQQSLVEAFHQGIWYKRSNRL